jgi:hypothetical protein
MLSQPQASVMLEPAFASPSTRVLAPRVSVSRATPLRVIVDGVEGLDALGTPGSARTGRRTRRGTVESKELRMCKNDEGRKVVNQ